MDSADRQRRLSREAIALAERLGGLIDLEMPAGLRQATIAKSHEGCVSATYGELHLRCDLAIFWCNDFSETHPRFVERYLDAEQLIAIGPEPITALGDRAEHIQVPRASQTESLTKLLMLLEDRPTSGPVVEPWADLLAQNASGQVWSVDLRWTARLAAKLRAGISPRAAFE